MDNRYYNPLLDGDDVTGTCSLCGGLGWLRGNARPGEQGFGELTPCPCQSATIATRKRERLERISGLKPSELALRIEQFIQRGNDTPEMVERVQQFLSHPIGMLTLWGGWGNGKTLALQVLVNELRERHGWVTAYVRFHDLLDYIRAGCAPGADMDKRQRYEEIRAVKLLAIDEIDKASMTDFAHEFRTAILDDRYRSGLEGEAFTVLAMNDDPAVLPGYIYDRLRRFVIFHNADSSLRPQLARTQFGGWK